MQDNYIVILLSEKNIFTHYIIDMGLISKMYKKFIQSDK